MSMVKSKALRHVLFGLGCISFALGAIGILIPLLPTTPFLLAAAWLFLKSSPAAHNWIYERSPLGPVLKDWDARGAISRSAKASAIAMMTLSLAVIWLKSKILWLPILLTLVLLSISAFILTRPSQ